MHTYRYAIIRYTIDDQRGQNDEDKLEEALNELGDEGFRLKSSIGQHKQHCWEGMCILEAED
jgi:hypothetical protein